MTLYQKNELVDRLVVHGFTIKDYELALLDIVRYENNEGKIPKAIVVNGVYIPLTFMR